MTEQPEIKKIAEEINSTFADLRSEQNSIKGKIDALDNLKLDRMVDEITTKLDDMQKSQSKMEAAINRPEFNGGEEKEDIEAKSREVFDAFMRDSKTKEEVEVCVKAMSTDVNPDGGYLVMPSMANFVVDRIFETSPMRQIARVETIGTKSLEVLIDDNEAGARWIDEGASSGDTTTPQIGKMEIAAHKLEADPKITTEQLQDSFLNVESWLQGKVADKFSRTENTSFVNGNGVGKPRGFLTYDAWGSAGVYERNGLEQVNLGNASAVTADGLIELQNSLKEPYQGNAVFVMQRASYGAILKLKGNDQYFFGQTLLKDGQMSPTLLGKRVIFMDDMPSIASNSLAFAYGDFGVGYTIVDRVGLTVLKDPYTNKGFLTYYTTKRTGGAVTNYDSIKIGKIAS